MRGQRARQRTSRARLRMMLYFSHRPVQRTSLAQPSLPASAHNCHCSATARVLHGPLYLLVMEMASSRQSDPSQGKAGEAIHESSNRPGGHGASGRGEGGRVQPIADLLRKVLQTKGVKRLKHLDDNVRDELVRQVHEYALAHAGGDPADEWRPFRGVETWWWRGDGGLTDEEWDRLSRLRTDVNDELKARGLAKHLTKSANRP